MKDYFKKDIPIAQPKVIKTINFVQRYIQSTEDKDYLNNDLNK